MEKTKLISIPDSERDRLWREFSRLTEPEKIAVFSRQTDIMRQWRREGNLSRDHIPEAAAVALLAAVRGLITQFRAPAKMSAEVADQIKKMRIALAKKRKTRPAKLAHSVFVRHEPLIGQLREEGLSWAQVSNYLSRHHNKRITGDYLRKYWKKRKEEKP